MSSERKQEVGKVLAEVEPEDLIKFGLIRRPPAGGRDPDELDEPALIKILTEPKNAITKQFKKLFEMENVELEFRPDALSAIARKALKRKTGARGAPSSNRSCWTPCMTCRRRRTSARWWWTNR